MNWFSELLKFHTDLFGRVIDAVKDVAIEGIKTSGEVAEMLNDSVNKTKGCDSTSQNSESEKFNHIEDEEI